MDDNLTSEIEELAQKIDLEQAMQAIASIAKMVTEYYEALQERGFTSAQALILTAAFQTQLMRKGT